MNKRILKFRIYDPERKMMEMVGAIDWAQFDDGLRPITVNTETKKFYQLEDELLLMQFTGLFDKNGKEIYEGDIVKGTDMKPSGVSGQSEVFYHTGRWQPFDYLHDYSGTNVEIIGNIYEHPSLLKSRSEEVC